MHKPIYWEDPIADEIDVILEECHPYGIPDHCSAAVASDRATLVNLDHLDAVPDISVVIDLPDRHRTR